MFELMTTDGIRNRHAATVSSQTMPTWTVGTFKWKQALERSSKTWDILRRDMHVYENPFLCVLLMCFYSSREPGNPRAIPSLET